MCVRVCVCVCACVCVCPSWDRENGTVRSPSDGGPHFGRIADVRRAASADLDEDPVPRLSDRGGEPPVELRVPASERPGLRRRSHDEQGGVLLCCLFCLFCFMFMFCLLLFCLLLFCFSVFLSLMG